MYQEACLFGFSFAIHLAALCVLLFLIYTVLTQAKKLALLRLAVYWQGKEKAYLANPLIFARDLASALGIPCRILDNAVKSKWQNIDPSILFDFVTNHRLSLMEINSDGLVLHSSSQVASCKEWSQKLEAALKVSVIVRFDS